MMKGNQIVIRICMTLLCLSVVATPSIAQVVRDGSIGPGGPGPVGSGTFPNGDPNGDFADFLITDDLGEIVGGTLFHSFSEFSVGSGQVAVFTGPSTISVIIARNTAPQGTFLFGTLRSTMPQAELFFASPGGIVIGAGARLDIPASFHATTATMIEFGSDPLSDLPTDSVARPMLLSSLPPSAFGFGPTPGPISIGAVDPNDPTRTLSVPPGETLSLTGGDITLTGVPNAAPFFFQGNVIGAPGTNVELASTTGNQKVPLRRVNGRTRIDFDQLPSDLLDGSILLQQNARIDVGVPRGSGAAAGSFTARAGTFRILDGRITSNHESDLVDAGDIDIGARDTIELDSAGVTSATLAGGRGANMSLRAGSISIGGRSLIRTVSTSDGSAGDFKAEARTILLTEDQTTLSSINIGTGKGGDIELLARGAAGEGRIELRGEGQSANGIRLGPQILSNPRGDGAGGGIRLEADTIEVSNSADVLSITKGGATATGGDIEIRSSNLVVQSGSFVASSTLGDARGGAVDVEGLDGTPADSVLVRNAGAESEPARISTNTTSTRVGAGAGGALRIRTQSLALLDGGQIFARTEGAGNTGSLEVEADIVQISGTLENPNDANDPFRSGITARVGDIGASGSGTLLSIDSRILDVENGGQISSSTFGKGDAGLLKIVSRERMSVTGGANGASVISARAVAGPTAPGGGRGGVIEIDTPLLELRNGGQISSSTVGEGDPGNVGDAGDVLIQAGRVEISGAAGFDTSGVFSQSASIASQGIGAGGDVTLSIDDDLVLSNGGRIEVSSSGDGNAGNIRLDVGGALDMDTGAQILSSTGVSSLGNAGSVEISAAHGISLRSGSEISASTGAQSSGTGGVVSIQSNGALRIDSGSAIRSRSDGFGDAGDINLAAARVSASGASSISTEANSASGGSITIDALQVFELDNASAITSVQGALGRDAGNILIRTPGQVVVNRGAVVAQAIQGAGGRIEVTSGGSFISGDSLISASSQQGPQGEIELTPPENALIAELTSLPAALEDPSQLLRNACDLRTEREGSFTVHARKSATPPPEESLSLPGRAPIPLRNGCD